MVESIIYFKIKIELHAKLSDASCSTLSDLCLFLVQSGVSGIVSAGLIAIASSGLPGEEDREVPTLLVDELEEATMALAVSSWVSQWPLQLESSPVWLGTL